MDSAPYSTDRAVYHDGKEDILEPLKRYREEFRDEFARRAAKTFEDLVTQTGTDAAANRELCALIQAQDAERDTKIFKRRWLIALLVLLWLGLAACIGIVYMDIQQLRIAGADNTTVQSLIISVISGLTAIMLLITLHHRSAAMKQAINELSAAIEANIRLAYQQLEALNASYSWHIIHDLISATVPRIALDPYFSESRLDDLVHHFGYSHSLYSDRSVLTSQSGDLNGNPFVFADLLGMRWQDHTYTGYKHITWKRRERSYDGKWRTVTHHQTLSASVTAPVPEYYQHPVVIYGNEAAPALAFSRVPSEHSGAEDTWWNNLKKARTIRKLEKFSRNLDDDSNYTIMGNRDFEALFQAVDRSDEVEFRLLFTALAQIQMLELLNDRETGFGDNFHFVKDKKLNYIFPRHLSGFKLDTDPADFRDYNLERARNTFQQRCEDYFRRIYFALAPLLTIPLYQQTPMRKRGYTPQHEDAACFWDHEALANFMGEQKFAHPRSVTRNILKTAVNRRCSGISEVEVTAHGYRTEKRVEYVSVMGGDGRMHRVAVPWLEYLPVAKSTVIRVTEHISGDEARWQERKNALQAQGFALDRAIHKKAIYGLK